MARSQRYAFVRGPTGVLVPASIEDDDACVDEMLETFRTERKLSSEALQRVEGSVRAVERGLRSRDSQQKLVAVMATRPGPKKHRAE